jgi:DNA-binding NarL/FixJ family response regulator
MAPDDPTRVLLVDDHALVRAGLSALLGAVAHIDVVGEAADGRRAVDLATRLRPDVVLMDLSMPVLNGIEATRRIARDAPGTHVVMLTSIADRRRVSEAIDAGAQGYLLKDCDTQDIIAAVASASRGGKPIDPRVADGLRSRRAPPAPAQWDSPGHRPPRRRLWHGWRHHN